MISAKLSIKKNNFTRKLFSIELLVIIYILCGNYNPTIPYINRSDSN